MGAIIHNGIIYGGSIPINNDSPTNKTTYSSNKIESRLTETQSIIGESYEPTKSYAVKERFIDGNIIYTVKVACQGVTPPNSTYYTGRKVVDEINALNSEIESLRIISKSVFIPSIQLDGNGEADIRSYAPTSEGTFLACMIYHQSSVIPRGALQVLADGTWLNGPVNAEVKNLSLRYFYQL